MILSSQTILYVDDQERSAAFYRAVLNIPPRLHVPGMTEFELAGDAVLGLVPRAGIIGLLGSANPAPDGPTGLLRAELYLLVDDPAAYLRGALDAGARPLSDLAPRDWGHLAAYCLDPGGHVLAFAGG